jgi:hypothetical protein
LNASSFGLPDRIFTEFKVVGPSGGIIPPSIVTEPVDLTRTVGQTAGFNVGAAGTAPRYQWYFDADPDVALPQATNMSLSLTNVQTTNAGGYYVIVTNSAGSATSRVAILTVNLPVITPPGLIVDDTWADGDRLSGPVSTSNSVWYASAALVSSVGSMVGSPDAATSRLWVGYFTEDPLVPVDLAIGRAIKATVVFTPTNVAPQNTGTLRFGMYCYSDGGVRLSGDGFGGSAGNGAQVTGYMLSQNFGTSFGEDDPMNLLARTSLNDGNLMGSAAAYQSLGTGPDGLLNSPAFLSETQYTLEFQITRMGQTAVNVDARIRGASLDISLHRVDSVYAYRRFDSFAIRANRTTDSAEQLNFTRFKVEVIEAAIPPRITAFTLLSSDAAKISWSSISNRVYQVQSRDSLTAGAWVTNATVTATGESTSYTNSGLLGLPERYYRVVNVF